MIKKLTAICLILFTLVLSGCTNGSGGGDKPKINDAYLTHLAGKTFQADVGQCITFYENGYATYDYESTEHHYYRYIVKVTNSTDTQIDMTLEIVVADSSDHEEKGPEPATYYISTNSLHYYQPYTCISDPGQVIDFSNAYGTFTTICAQDGCAQYIAPSGNTMYCPEHSSSCEQCEIYINSGNRFCSDCPHCYSCKTKLEPDTGYECDSCKIKNYRDKKNKSEKCSLCNGTGVVKYYYGASDAEAYADGHDPSWYGQCGVCEGSGYTD